MKDAKKRHIFARDAGSGWPVVTKQLNGLARNQTDLTQMSDCLAAEHMTVFSSEQMSLNHSHKDPFVV